MTWTAARRPNQWRSNLDGKSYEIDLSEKHAAALRDAFAPFVSSARRAGGAAGASRPRMSSRSSAGSGRPRTETTAIREWATANGLEVSARGRIASSVLEAYENRGNTIATPTAEPVLEPVAAAEDKPKRRTRKKAAAEG
jgi:nucleoid-associated protein Lsr2